MSSSSSSGGCVALLALVIVGYLVFSATGGDIKQRVTDLTKDTKSGDLAADFYVENYPWPHLEVDAVKKCVLAIQSRNWQNYDGCFEPSAILSQEQPGLPGQFRNMTFELLISDGIVGMVRIKGEWVPSTLTGINQTVTLSNVVTVVKARKGIIKSVKVNVDVAMEGWFVVYNETALPFNISSRLNTPKLTPTPTASPTQTPESTRKRRITHAPTTARALFLARQVGKRARWLQFGACRCRGATTFAGEYHSPAFRLTHTHTSGRMQATEVCREKQNPRHHFIITHRRV